MKKIVSMILCLIMLLNFFSFTYAAEYTAPVNSEEFAGLLSALGIINPDDYIDGKRIITRGEFTSLIIKAEGLGGYLPENANIYFSDVPDEHPFASYIALAKERKLSVGYSDGTFRPDDAISYAEAVVYLIRIMGYTDLAESSNGFPYGYILTAEHSGISKGIKLAADYTVTAEIALHLIFNALNTRVMVMDTFGEDGASFETSYGNTLMYESFRVLAEKGIADEVSLSALTGANNLPPYSISVNNVVMDVGEFSPRHLLGYNVNAYYKYEDSKNVLIYIYDNPDKNEIKSVNIEDITDISGFTIKYTDAKGNSKSYRYERGAAIIYNGVSTKSAFNTSIYLDKNGNKLSGNIELLDNDGDGTSDVVYINAYEEFVAGIKDKSNTILYDKKDPLNKITLDTSVNDPYTIIIDEDGDEISFSKIKENMSVIVQRSKADAYQGYIRVYVSSKTAEGVLEVISEEETGKEAIISGEVYKLSSYAVKHLDNSLIGKEIVARLNKFGEITIIEPSNPDGAMWGMLLLLKPADNISDSAKFYIYTEDGVTEAIEPAKKITIDNRQTQYTLTDSSDFSSVSSILQTAASKTNTRYSGSDRLNTMIRYRVNDDGKLISIDTVLNSGGVLATRDDMETNDLLYMDTFTNLTCVTYSGISIGAKILAGDNNKVFLYPSSEEADYGITVSESVYKHGSKYTGYAFYINPDSVVADATVQPSGMNYYENSTSSYLTMVQKITTTVDEDGALANKLYLYTNNQLSTYLCKSDMVSEGEGEIKIKNLSQGDIIYLSVDRLSGEISSFQLRYSAKDDKLYNISLNNQLITKAYAYKLTSEGMHYVPVDTTLNIASEYKNGNYRAARFDGKVSVTVYDKNAPLNNRVKPGGYDDIISWTAANSGCTKLIMHTYNTGYHLTRGIFVIK